MHLIITSVYMCCLRVFELNWNGDFETGKKKYFLLTISKAIAFLKIVVTDNGTKKPLFPMNYHLTSLQQSTIIKAHWGTLTLESKPHVTIISMHF